MDQGRAEVELAIQIGAETDEEVLAILMKEVRPLAKRMLGRPERAEMIEEEQWCSGAMRVTLRRPGLEDA